MIDPTLTKREIEILVLVAVEGLTSREAADHLNVSKRTIDFHLANVYTKLEVTNRIQAYRKAIRRGLIQPKGD